MELKGERRLWGYVKKEESGSWEVLLCSHYRRMPTHLLIEAQPGLISKLGKQD